MKIHLHNLSARWAQTRAGIKVLNLSDLSKDCQIAAEPKTKIINSKYNMQANCIFLFAIGGFLHDPMHLARTVRHEMEGE